MHLDLLNQSGWGIIPAAALPIGAFTSIILLAKQNMIPFIATLAVTVGIVFGTGYAFASHDNAAMEQAVQQRYGITLTDSEAGDLRIQPSAGLFKTVPPLQTATGPADIYGTTTVYQAGKAERVTLYQRNGTWILGKASASLHELPVAGQI